MVEHTVRRRIASCWRASSVLPILRSKLWFENHPVLTRPYGARLLTADRAASQRYHIASTTELWGVTSSGREAFTRLTLHDT